MVATMPPQPGFQTAAWLPKAGPGVTLEIYRDIEIPDIKPGYILIKLVCSNIYYSNIHFIFNKTPIETNIIGYEGIGDIIKLSADIPNNLIDTRVDIK
jgi:NADPH:quinone reductase-like Zn-dependent oxidoreductase